MIHVPRSGARKRAPAIIQNEWRTKVSSCTNIGRVGGPADDSSYRDEASRLGSIDNVPLTPAIMMPLFDSGSSDAFPRRSSSLVLATSGPGYIAACFRDDSREALREPLLPTVGYLYIYV